MKPWPKKPAKLDGDCAWVSVAAVEGAAGHPEDQLAWCTEYVAADRYTFGAIAKDAAAGWWRETDQSAECWVTIRIEDATGQVVEVRVHVEIVTRYTATQSPMLQTRVGQSVRPERRRAGRAVSSDTASSDTGRHGSSEAGRQ